MRGCQAPNQVLTALRMLFAEMEGDVVHIFNSGRSCMEEHLNEPVADSIEKVVKLAQQSHNSRTATAKIGSFITGGVGTMASIITHIMVILGWCVYNSRIARVPIDPFPYNLLTLFVSFESVLIALLVLMNQNRMARHDELREHLSLQIEVLLEQEITTALVLLKNLCEKQGITAQSSILTKLVETTDIQHLASELEKKLPTEL